MFTELCELHNFLHQRKWQATAEPTRLKIQPEKNTHFWFYSYLKAKLHYYSKPSHTDWIKSWNV